MDLEAETLPESRSFNAAPAHMGLEGWFYENYGILSPGRVEIPPKMLATPFLRKFGIRRVDAGVVIPREQS